MGVDIKLKLVVSEENRSITVSEKEVLEQFGLTKEEWDSLEEKGKIECLQFFADSVPEQPYWVVDTFRIN